MEQCTKESQTTPAEPSANPPEFVSVEALAQETGVSRNTLYEAIKQEKVPGVIRIGRRVIIHRQTFLDSATDGTGSREVRDASAEDDQSSR